jgi:2-C-methyl-D-erythritol 2,4-cyclodiphosphate synthase
MVPPAVEGIDVPRFRTGVGVDAHVFSLDENRPLWLAGLHWPGQVGLDAHSDGDVAAHAICDALLGAAGLGDLGTNFGTDRPEYVQASGAKLLAAVYELVLAAGYRVSNVCVQIIGNRPKLNSRSSEAVASLSFALGGADVSVSATTTDGLGFTGEGKGLAAIASALIY